VSAKRQQLFAEILLYYGLYILQRLFIVSSPNMTSYVPHIGLGLYNHPSALAALKEAALIGARHITGTSRVLESGESSVVGRVGSEVVEPEKSGTLALEDVGNPAEGIVEVPEGDADTGWRLSASTDGLCTKLVYFHS
jgi:hypothetical protein